MIPFQSHHTKSSSSSSIQVLRLLASSFLSLSTIFYSWIVVDDPFFITSYYSLQKWLNLIPFQRITNVNSVHHVPNTQLVRNTKHRASFCIQLYVNLKLFCDRCLVPWQSPQCSHAYHARLLP